MDYRNLIVIFSIGLALGVASCGGDSEETKAKHSDSSTEQALIKSNKYMVRSEEENIQDFLKRYQWEMRSSGTGLRYLIERSGSEKAVEYGDLVSLEYTIKLLNGDIVKSSKESGLMEFRVGKGGVESGLEEGVKMLKLGDKAKFIVPSHLAFGLLGDGKSIPSRATLVYEVKLLKVGETN